MTEATGTFFTCEKKTKLGTTYYLHIEFTTDEGLQSWVKWLEEDCTLFAVDPEDLPFTKEAKKPASRPAFRTKSSAQRATKAKSDVECDYCGGPTWDNMEDKRSPTAPDYRCRDRDNCGAAAWVNDGELTWKAGRPA